VKVTAAATSLLSSHFLVRRNSYHAYHSSLLHRLPAAVPLLFLATMSGIKGNAPISPMSLIIDPDIILVDSGDLTITLISSSGNGSIKHITSIQASAEECRKSYFLGPLIASGGEELTLGEGPPKRANGGELGVDYEDKEGVLIWLAHLHGLSVKEMSGLELDRISIAGVWHATLLWKYREDNNMATLGSWFNEWYMTFMKDNIFDGAAAKALAMSCYTFKHAEGFAYVTKWLVLNHVDYINEHFPTGFKAKGLRLPHAEFVGKWKQTATLRLLRKQSNWE